VKPVPSSTDEQSQDTVEQRLTLLQKRLNIEIKVRIFIDEATRQN
jgi:hypothetical protein